MSDIIEVLKTLHFELKRREAQVERRGDKGKKYCRDRLTVEADPKNRDQIKALKKTYERGWKQAADELTYFEDLFEVAVEWCADETEFTHQQIAKAIEVQFHPSRLKPEDRLFYQSVRELIPALKRLPPNLWTKTEWARSILMPRFETNIPGGDGVWQFDDGTVKFKGVSFPLRGREYDVLKILATSSRNTDADIAELLGGNCGNEAVRTHISNLKTELLKYFDLASDPNGKNDLCDKVLIDRRNRRRLRSEALSPKKAAVPSPARKRASPKQSATISKNKRRANRH